MIGGQTKTLQTGKPFRQDDQRGKPTREPCKFCGLLNHSTEQCYKNLKNAATLPVRDGVKKDQKNPLQCYICDKVGHTVPRCPDVEKRQQNRNATARKSSLKDEDKDGYPTEINGKKIKFKIGRNSPPIKKFGSDEEELASISLYSSICLICSL